MKRRAYCFAFSLWMVFLCTCLTGCADGLLDEIPRDLTVMWEETEETVEAAQASESSSEEKAVQAVCFLMEDAFSYAYESLSETEQIWYRDIEQILGSFSGGIRLSQSGLAGGLGDTNIDKIFQCVLSDHPELFYVDGYSYIKYAKGEKVTAIEFSGSYNVDLETALMRKEEINIAVEQLLAGIPADAPEYEKVKYVYETLIRNTDYDLDAPDNQNIYSVFVRNLSVCQGYAKGTQYLLNRMGIACTLVLGTVETGEGHAWNLVKVDGDYYYLDTTWGDVSYRTEDMPSGDGVESGVGVAASDGVGSGAGVPTSDSVGSGVGMPTGDGVGSGGEAPADGTPPYGVEGASGGEESSGVEGGSGGEGSSGVEGGSGGDGFSGGDGDMSSDKDNGKPAMPEINYDYLNVTTAELLRTHSIGGEVPMPVCTAIAANYYVREGALFTTYNREQMEALFQKAAETGQKDITIKCADAACYEEVLTILIEEQEIFDYLSNEESRIAYVQNEKQHSLTFWVTNE